MIPNTGRFSIQKLSAALICLCIAVFVLYAGSSFFIPLTFAMLFAFMLKPICDRVEDFVRDRVVAILVTLVFVSSLIGGVLAFFFTQISRVMREADGVFESLRQAGIKVLATVGAWLRLDAREIQELFDNTVSSTVNAPLEIVSTGLSTSTVLITSLALIIIYTFFFLLYRTAAKHFVIGQLDNSNNEGGEETLQEIQSVASNYLRGMGVVMLVLAVLNTAGLYAIGIQYAIVWGTLGALLAVIPYVGTALGGLLPLMYAIATTDTLWQPVAVIVLYALVQFVEGNFITPKVVGNSVRINALAAIVSIILGAALWGLAGVILAIPLLAMVRVVMDHVDPLKPVALLLSDDLYDHSDKFLREYNQPRYRLTSLFNARKERSPKFRLPGPEDDELAGEPVNHLRQTDAQIVAKPKAKQRDGDAGRQKTLIP